MGLVTVDKIAVSAAMAGCEQSHVPVLTTACEAVLKMGTRARRWLMSTSPGAPMMGTANLAASVCGWVAASDPQAIPPKGNSESIQS